MYIDMLFSVYFSCMLFHYLSIVHLHVHVYESEKKSYRVLDKNNYYGNEIIVINRSKVLFKTKVFFILLLEKITWNNTFITYLTKLLCI